MIKMTDNIIEDKKSESHGQSLAGVIDKELKIYKSDMEKNMELINYLSHV